MDVWAIIGGGIEAVPGIEKGEALPSTVKSDEELEKYTVDEHLSELERTVLFLNGGLGIQQRHAISNLPAIIRGRGRSAWECVQGPLSKALSKLDAESQVDAAEVFVQITQDRLMSPPELQACLLPTIVRNINKEKSEEETEAWVNALCELIPVIDKETLKSQVLPMALSKGSMEDNANSRVICVRILGACAPQLSKEEIDRTFFKKAMAMCQDVDYTVRLSMCEQLAAIGRACNKEHAMSSLLMELFELLRDEELRIRVAAYEALMALLDCIPPDQRRLKVLPVIRHHLQPFSLDIVMQSCVARNFAALMAGMKREFDREDVMAVHSCFKHLASKSETDLRRCCAQQLGPLTKASTSLNPNIFAEQFSDTFHHLAMDQDEQVRLNIASQLHELAHFISKERCCSVLHRPLVALLRDESSAVQMAVLPMLNTTLHHLVSASDRREQAVLDVLYALVDMEARCGRNWRIQLHLANSFPHFPKIFNSDQIHDFFMPMAFRFMCHSAAAVRPVAAEGIASFFRHCHSERQRAEVFLRLVREFARGRSFSHRMAFGDVCYSIVRRFSSRFIKEWFFDLILDLVYDSVPNIRLQVTRILPSLKQTIRLPEDVDLLERLNNAISNAMTDNDRDVSLLARQVNDSYKRTPVRMGASVSSTMGGSAMAFETEDRRREEEEMEMGFTPEDAKEMRMELMGQHKRQQPRASAPDGMRFPAGKKAELTRSGGLAPKGSAGSSGGLSGLPGRGGREEGGGRSSFTGEGKLFKDSGDRNSGGSRSSAGSIGSSSAASSGSRSTTSGLGRSSPGATSTAGGARVGVSGARGPAATGQAAVSSASGRGAVGRGTSVASKPSVTGTTRRK